MRIPIPNAAIALAALILVGGYCYGQNYVPTTNEEIYGTWTNTDTKNAYHIQKAVNNPDDWQEYGAL